MKEISLPSYINPLPQEIVDKLSISSEAERLIIACGVHPKDNSLMMVTGTGGIFSISPNGRMRPLKACPTFEGKKIIVVFHPPYGQHIISSQSALSIAEDEAMKTHIFANGSPIGKLLDDDK